MTQPSHRFRASRPTADEAGATAVEYALLLALIAVAIMFTVAVLGQRVDSAFGSVSNSISGAAQQGGGGQGDGAGQGGSGSNGGGNGQGNNGNGNGNGGSNGSWGGNPSGATSTGSGGGKGGK